MRRLAALALVLVAAPVAAAPRIPPPPIDVTGGRDLQVAVLAGGCFWGMEAVFEHVKGVRTVVSGYAGGRSTDASYDKVSSETTGHAEAVRIVFDRRQVRFGQLLNIYFAAHDPTQVNRQGPDTGPSYRSAIFPQDSAQRRVAEAYLAKLRTARAFPGRIATRIESGPFFAAEAIHQDFARRNPNHPYILRWDAPKLAAVKAQFPAMWK
jgi:peptide-methionine (S)-S-oxide reductase